jgi:hypothetical protein
MYCDISLSNNMLQQKQHINIMAGLLVWRKMFCETLYLSGMMNEADAEPGESVQVENGELEYRPVKIRNNHKPPMTSPTDPI